MRERFLDIAAKRLSIHLKLLEIKGDGQRFSTVNTKALAYCYHKAENNGIGFDLPEMRKAAIEGIPIGHELN